jgi:hypothetical protein
LPVIIATQEAEIRRIGVQSQPRQNSLQDPYLEKTQHTIKEMVEWLKVVPELKPQYHKKKKKKKVSLKRSMTVILWLTSTEIKFLLFWFFFFFEI